MSLRLGLGVVQKSFMGEEGTRGISGGKRKIVAVGAELVTNPQLIFSDETREQNSFNDNPSETIF